MLCQHFKRIKWQAKLSATLYKVPYVHTTFTLPKELRSLARRNPKEIYNLLFQSAWSCIQKVGKLIGAELGMISVLHTWGSDMKYHVHIHCLITFGGLNNKGEWIWPKSTRRLAGYDRINKYYRTSFLSGLEKLFAAKKVDYHKSYETLKLELGTKQWVVNNTLPSENTEVVEAYLAKYINRSAVSAKRLHYNSQNGQVILEHKDYVNQVKGESAKYISTKLRPLVVIDKILQHKLPPYYHRVRYYGIHQSSKRKKLQSSISGTLLRNVDSIKVLFELLTKLIKATKNRDRLICSSCGNNTFEISKQAGDQSWIYRHVVDYALNKGPPMS